MIKQQASQCLEASFSNNRGKLPSLPNHVSFSIIPCYKSVLYFHKIKKHKTNLGFVLFYFDFKY